MFGNRGVSKVTGVVVLVAIVLIPALVAGTAAFRIADTQEPPTQVAADTGVDHDDLRVEIAQVDRAGPVDLHADEQKLKDDYVPETGDTFRMTNLSKGDSVRMVAQPDADSAYVVWERESLQDVGTPADTPVLVSDPAPGGGGTTTCAPGPGSPDIVVASDGSGDYTGVENAVDNATSGDTVYILDCGSAYSPATMPVSKPLTVRSNNATLSGSGTLFDVKAGATLTVENLTVRSYSTGVNTNVGSGAVTVRNSRFVAGVGTVLSVHDDASEVVFEDNYAAGVF